MLHRNTPIIWSVVLGLQCCTVLALDWTWLANATTIKKSIQLCGTSNTDPTGECQSLYKCLIRGGKADVLSSNCQTINSCCNYVFTCGGSTPANVVQWRTENYPLTTTGPSICRLSIYPASDTCYIRIQFLDTQLTAATINRCDGNTLTIYNQAEGDGNLICSSLVNYETFVKVSDARTPVEFELNIRDISYKYDIRITQVNCSAAGGLITNPISGRSNNVWEYKSIFDLFDFSSQEERSNKGNNLVNSINKDLLKYYYSTRKAEPKANVSQNDFFEKLFDDNFQLADSLDQINEQLLPQTEAPQDSTATANIENLGNQKWFYKLLKESLLKDPKIKSSLQILADQLSNRTPSKEFMERPGPKLFNVYQFIDFVSHRLNSLTNSSSVFDPSSLTRISGLNTPDSVTVDDVCLAAESHPNLRISFPATPAQATVVKNTFMGTVMIKTEGTDDHNLCACVLISTTYVLTSASCLLRRGYDNSMYSIRVFYVFKDKLGVKPKSYARHYARAPYYTAKRVIFHPMYDHNNFHFDIAVIELATAVTGRTPISLPTTTTETYTGLTVAEMGFGFRKIQTHLGAGFFETKGRFANGVVQTTAACQTAYSAGNAATRPMHTSYTGQLIKDEMICLKMAASTQNCPGDYGGPIVLNYPAKPVLIGLISGNYEGCVDPDKAGRPLGAYPDIGVRITSVLDFINIATTDITYDVISSSGGLNIFTLLTAFLG